MPYRSASRGMPWLRAASRSSSKVRPSAEVPGGASTARCYAPCRSATSPRHTLSILNEGTPSIGSVVGGCRIKSELGRGGMGVVYLAEQEALGRRVALKVISPALAGDVGFRARFERESRLAASIDHPNIVPVYSAGESEGLLYI